MPNGWRTISSLVHTQNSTSRSTRERNGWILLATKIKARTAEGRWITNPVWPSSCVTPAGTSNELDVQNGWEENTHTHRDTRNCSPIPVFCFLYSKILPVTKMRLNVCFNEMALFGLLQLLSKAVAAMAEMEVSPQEEMANSQGMKRFAIERPGLNEGFVSFPVLCGVQSSPLVFAPSLPIVWGPLQ